MGKEKMGSITWLDKSIAKASEEIGEHTIGEASLILMNPDDYTEFRVATHCIGLSDLEDQVRFAGFLLAPCSRLRKGWIEFYRHFSGPHCGVHRGGEKTIADKLREIADEIEK